MRLRRKRVDLVDRLRPYGDGGEPPEPMVSADPIRMFLYQWMIETGDPIEVVATGFDVDVELISAIVNGERWWLTWPEAALLAAHVGFKIDRRSRSSTHARDC